MIGFADPLCQFATELEQAEGPEARQALFARTVEAYGVEKYAYLNISRRFAPWHLESTYPDEWRDHYVASRYDETDVVMTTARKVTVPFAWKPLLEMPETTPAAHRVFAEASVFGIRDGMTVPIHCADGFAMMSLVTGDPRLLAPEAAAERQAVQLMALYYHSTVERQAAREPAVRLTPREREILTWAAQGKTGWEIAQILHLAERTVIFHIENAKAKLGANSRSHAVVRAMMLGLIAP
ncbi:MAG: helix-turn-helix transcriptional regulator [Solirubrobacterales bacterium]